MIIQIIGSPASGKSYAIEKYLSDNKKNIKYLDIADYKNNSAIRIKRIKHDIYKYSKTNKNIILESACGVNIKNSYIIKYNKDKKEIFANFLEREKYLDTNYLSILEDMELKPNYTVSDQETMHKLLDYLLFKKRF